MKTIQNTLKIEEKFSDVPTKFRVPVGPKKVVSVGFPETRQFFFGLKIIIQAMTIDFVIPTQYSAFTFNSLNAFELLFCVYKWYAMIFFLLFRTGAGAGRIGKTVLFYPVIGEFS